MYSELIVMAVNGEEEADKVWQTLEQSHTGRLFKLVDSVMIHRDDAGMPSIKPLLKESGHLYNNQSRLAGAFAETIFGVSGAEGRRRLTKAGLDPRFLADVDKALDVDRTTYLFYVSRESLVDTRRHLEILKGFQGDLYHTTFGPQVEEALLKPNN